jgi:signal transduction histidine kinase
VLAPTAEAAGGDAPRRLRPPRWRMAAARGGGVETALRVVPIRWRILAIAVLNTAFVLLLAIYVAQVGRDLSAAWRGLQEARRSERLLVSLEGDIGRLQTLIHRYFTQPTPEVLDDIGKLRESVLDTLRGRGPADTGLADRLYALTGITERFLGGFDDLRTLRDGVPRLYEAEIAKPTRDIAGLYSIIDGATPPQQSLIWPSLGKSREAFSAMLLAVNTFYLSLSAEPAEEARRQLASIVSTIPVMLDLAENDLQRGALKSLQGRAAELRAGIDDLARSFDEQSRILRETIDGNRDAMAKAVATLVAFVQVRAGAAQQRFDDTVDNILLKIAVVGAGFVLLSVLAGILVARSVSAPLADLDATMQAIAAGDLERHVEGLAEKDEIGDMARAVAVFRGNAVAKQQAEKALRASRDRAENALAELKEAQDSLIEAEKLAALGSLVAGVAHEVNNPVGISLTVASTLARRSATFEEELKSGQLRRSRLVEFTAGVREAAEQLVANLRRAGELVQSFKQVAVDRSHAERRSFDLAQSTEDIVASLRPGLKKRRVVLAIDVPPGIVMDSYPGPYGQVLTNLFLNAVTHAFEGEQGAVTLSARLLGAAQVEIVFADDGRGMPEDVQRRAFDPFFTTRRGQGGTGLGLHIVYNLVSRRLGGRIGLASAPGKGTTFRIVLPLVAPRADDAAPG